MSEQRSYTPAVRKAAASLGVDLTKVTGTGAGGRVCLADVRTAAGLPPQGVAPAAVPPRAEAPARRAPVEVRSLFDDRFTVTINVYGRNPLLEDLQKLSPGAAAAAAAAARRAPTPTLFADGDLPAFTVSGIDPRELLKVPWYARHACAAATSASTILAAIEHFAHDPADFMGEYQHNGAADYVERMKQWLTDRSQMNAVYDTSYTPPVSGLGDGGYKASAKREAAYAPKRR